MESVLCSLTVNTWCKTKNLQHGLPFYFLLSTFYSFPYNILIRVLWFQAVRADEISNLSDEIGKQLSVKSAAAGLR